MLRWWGFFFGGLVWLHLVPNLNKIIPMSLSNVHIGENSEKVGELVGQLVFDLSAKAIAENGKFTIALSGGSMPKILGKGLSGLKSTVDFSKWHVFFADERCVALDHADSNYKACYDSFFKHSTIPANQIYTINASLSPEEAAKDYAQKLDALWPSKVPQLDLILLGMGPDGHTCSLFPGHALLDEHSLNVAHILDSPKPPPQRITLTYPVLNNARCVSFVAVGEGKASLMPQMVGLESVDVPLPAARIKPSNQPVQWYIDSAAAGKLKDFSKM